MTASTRRPDLARRSGRLSKKGKSVPLSPQSRLRGWHGCGRRSRTRDRWSWSGWQPGAGTGVAGGFVCIRTAGGQSPSRYRRYRGYFRLLWPRSRGTGLARSRSYPPTMVPLRISIVALVMVREKFPLRLTGVVPTAVSPLPPPPADPSATDKAPGSATAEYSLRMLCIRSLMVLVSTAPGGKPS